MTLIFRADVNAQGATFALRQHLEIAPRLRRLDNAEAVVAAGDRHVSHRVVGDLQEYAGVRSTLIGLTGRMQEARSKPEASSCQLTIAYFTPHLLQHIVVALIHFDVCEEREVIPRPDTVQMSTKIPRERLIPAGGCRQCRPWSE